MIYASTQYAASAAEPVNDPLELTDPQLALKHYLEHHGVDTREIHGNIYAYDAWTVKGVPGGEWVNATAWTRQDARDFLGY